MTHRLIFAVFILSTLFPGLANALVILQYHHVNASTPAITSVTPEVFREHMTLLEEKNMTVVNLEEALQSIMTGEPLPDVPSQLRSTMRICRSTRMPGQNLRNAAGHLLCSPVLTRWIRNTPT